MKLTIATAAAMASLTMFAMAQEPKPVPKDSVRVFVPGCTKGYIFTAGRRTADAPGSTEIPEGTHMRMNLAKKMATEIKAREGTMIELTGVMKKSDFTPAGINLGGGVRIMPGTGSAPSSGSRPPTSIADQIVIDVEAWRSIPGGCRR